MIQYARYIPIILELLKQGQNAKEIVSNFGKSNSKLKDLEYLSQTGISASKILQDLFTDTEKDKEKYPEEIFQSKFGDYLKSIDSKSKKDFKNAVKNIAQVGLVAYSLSGLGKKYPVPDIQVEETITPEEPQAPVAQPLTPPQLPAPPEVVRAQPGEIITPPVTPKQRGQIKRFEAAKRLQPEMTMAEAKAPSISQPSAISIQPSAPQPSAVTQAPESQPILFDTETYKRMRTPGNAIRQVVEQGFDQKQIEKFVNLNFRDFASRFENETGKSIKTEIKDLIANRGRLKVPEKKPKQLFTSKEDKQLQDAGLKPKLKPMRKKQQMGDFMKQIQESARPTESLTAPTDRQAFMNSMLEIENLLGDS